MSYHGYLPVLKGYVASLPEDHVPTLLEVGVDRGVSFITMATFLARTRPRFKLVGIDVVRHEQVLIVLSNLDLVEGQEIVFIEGNSLQVLPRLAEEKMLFDVVMLDGDHNYHTVSNELSTISSLIRPQGLVLCDDYDGRWSDRDLWYSERDGYEGVTISTTKVDTEKHGVKPAVDDWLAMNPGWSLKKLMTGEAVILHRE